MKPFKDLTYLGQVRRLRKLALSALEAYDVDVTECHLIFHGENTTFHVNVSDTVNDMLPDAYTPNRFLLRVHRPGYQNVASIASELAWLAALRADGIVVPEPMPTRDGMLFTEAAAPGVPTPRVCSLLRWMRGRFYARPHPHHFIALGRLMAQLHEHAAHWQPPSTFARRSWDWDGLFGDGAGFNLPESDVWALLPDVYAKPFRTVAEDARIAMDALGTGPDAFGLIHADLHLGNVLFADGEARPIDFDDCGYAHWVYDFAVVLAEYLDDDNWPAFRNALFDGYAEIRPLPEQQLTHLNTFMAARLVSLALWATDMAQINPKFGERLDRWYAWAHRSIGSTDRTD